MKTCMFTGMFRNESFETAVKNAALLGFDAIEIRYHASHFEPDESESSLKEKAKYIRDAGLEVAEIYTFTGGFSTKSDAECEKELETFRREAEAACILGTDMVKISSGGPNAFLAKPYHFEKSAEWLARAADIAERNHLRISLEIHNGSLVEDIDHALQLIRMIGRDSVGLIHDAGNMYITGEEYGEHSVERLGDHLFHVHVKDVLRVSDPSLPNYFTNITPRGEESFRLTALNEGGVDHLPMLRALKKRNYQGYISLEANISMDAMEMAKHEYRELQNMLKQL